MPVHAVALLSPQHAVEGAVVELARRSAALDRSPHRSQAPTVVASLPASPDLHLSEDPSDGPPAGIPGLAPTAIGQVSVETGVDATPRTGR